MATKIYVAAVDFLDYIYGMEIDTYLKTLRARAKALPYTRAELSRKAGFSRTTLDEWDNIATWKPSVRILRKLERFVTKEEGKGNAS